MAKTLAASIDPTGPALDPALAVEVWEIGRVIPYHNNPRRNAKAIAVVVASLKRYGWRQPIVVDAAGVIIVGHTRLLAAQALRCTHVPVHVAHDMPADDVRAYRIADNATHEYAEWDEALLSSEALHLKSVKFDLNLLALKPDLLTRVLSFGNPVPLPSLPSGDKPPFEQMSFVLQTLQAADVREALALAKERGLAVSDMNENSNGNALHAIVRAFLDGIHAAEFVP